VRSLADLGGDGDEDSDKDDRNEYYAGGEKSGQVPLLQMHACAPAPVPWLPEITAPALLILAAVLHERRRTRRSCHWQCWGWHRGRGCCIMS
jgi:hypothetical protein